MKSREEKSSSQNKKRNRLRSRNRSGQNNIRQMTAIRDYYIDLHSQIGGGAYGRVYKAYKRGKDPVYACKRIGKNKIENKDLYMCAENDQSGTGRSEKERLIQEIQVHKSFPASEHIVKLYDDYQEEDAYYLFMEFCEKDLSKQLAQRVRLPEEEALDYFKQITEGYKVLFDHKVSHRDLKPQNLLLSGNKIKLTDFGFVKLYENPDAASKNCSMSKFLTDSLVGTPLYMAPEILKPEEESIKNKYNPYISDVWSMGIILYKMLYGKYPFSVGEGKDLYSAITTGTFKVEEKIEVRPELIQLLRMTLQVDVKKRMTFPQVYKYISQLIYSSKKQGVFVSETEKVLTFYNRLMSKISYDSANHATFREIGIQSYQKFSARLMTFVHDRRDKELEGIKGSGDVAEAIKNESAEYHNTFYQAIKEVAELECLDGGLSQLLAAFELKLENYDEFEYLHKQFQYFLLLMLLLSRLEKKLVTINYIYTILQKEQTLTLTQLKSIKTKLKI